MLIRIVVLASGLLLPLASCFAQQQSLSLRLGVIRNLQDSHTTPHYALYPELQYEYKLSGSTSGAFYWGYWNDGVVAEAASFKHWVSHAYHSHILGLRYRADVPVPLLQVGVLLGVARHFVWADYLIDSGLGAEYGRDYRKRYSAGEVGAYAGVPVKRGLALQFEVQQYTSIPVLAAYDASQRAYKVGLLLDL